MSATHPEGWSLTQLLAHLDREHWSESDEDEELYGPCSRCGEPVWDPRQSNNDADVMCIDCDQRADYEAARRMFR